MSITTVSRQAGVDEIAAEMDRRGRVIENLELEISDLIHARDQWHSIWSDTQDALQKLGEKYGVDAREPRIVGLERVLEDQQRALATAGASLTELDLTNAKLNAALIQADDAIGEYLRYLDGGEMRGSYDGKPERDGLRRAKYATRAALRSQS